MADDVCHEVHLFPVWGGCWSRAEANSGVWEEDGRAEGGVGGILRWCPNVSKRYYIFLLFLKIQ